jgi:hypothetical protein
MKKRRIIPTEAQEQMAVVQWWQRYAPTKGLDPRLLCCSANGAILAGDARRRAMQMNKLKKMGLVPGDPDLFLRVNRGKTFSGLFIEMKRRNWVMPAPGKGDAHFREQRVMLALLRNHYCASFCAGADEAISLIKEYVELEP